VQNKMLELRVRNGGNVVPDSRDNMELACITKSFNRVPTICLMLSSPKQMPSSISLRIHCGRSVIIILYQNTSLNAGQ